MELDMEEPLDFEVDDDFAPPKPTTNKRKKMIDLDDLLLDCKRDEERLKKIKTSKGAKAKKRSAVDEDEERLSKAVNDVHRLINEIDGQDNASNGLEVKDEIPVWGLHVLGTQNTPSHVHCPAIEKTELFLTFCSSDLNSLIELSPAKGEVFLEGFLLNGWLLNYALYCGHVEAIITKWTLNLLLFSPEESLSSAACDFWCSILLKNKDDSSIKIEWLPSYSLLKGVLESYGFLLHSKANMLSDTELTSDGINAKRLLNLRAWIKLVDACCQARSRYPMFSTNEVEELTGYVICLLLDRRLQGLSVCLNQCICSCISFFEEEKWNTSCEAVAKFLACRVPRNMNCLRIVECILGINSRSMKLRSRIAFEVLKICFKEDADVHDILRALISINIKCTNCNMFDIYIYIILTENLLIFNDFRDEEIVDMWGIFLRKCSTHITNTNFRPYAQEVRNRASYILQSLTH